MARKISATARRDGEFWLVYVPEVDQHTQARTLAEAREMARELAALLMDVSVAEVHLDRVDIIDPEEEPSD